MLSGTSLLAVLISSAGLTQSSEDASATRPSPERISAALEREGSRPLPVMPDGDAESSRKYAIRLRQADSELLLPEDSPISNVVGSLQGADQSWLFVFQSDYPPMPVLPNSQLEKMERYTLGSGKEVRFNIAGRVTEFRNRNYLLVRDVAILRAANRPVAPPPAGAGTEEVSSVDSLIEAMQDERPVSAGVPEPLPDGKQTARPAPRAVMPVAESRRIWPEDSHQSDRLGRLIPDGQHWRFAFESSSEAPGDPAVAVLSNLALERMLEISDDATRRVLFTVTGDITEYGGQNYMLIRRFVLHRDNGNLR